jgi:DNA-binding SARP family transcriptional activator
VRYGILGPVCLVVDGEWTEVARPRERRALAMLLLHANCVVSAERLVDALWRGAPPPTAPAQVRNTVAALRRVVRTGIGQKAPIDRVSGGFLMQVRKGELDLQVFESKADHALQLTGAGRFGAAAEALREALALWRGSALSGVGDHSFDVPAARLEEQRLACLEQRIELDIMLGRQRHVIGELKALAAEHPLRERLVELAMVALSRCGRRQDALDMFAAARKHLDDLAGLGPRPALMALQTAILRGDDLPEQVWGVATVAGGPPGAGGQRAIEHAPAGSARHSLEREAQRLRAENEMLRAQLDVAREAPPES